MNRREFLLMSMDYRFRDRDVLAEGLLYRTQWDWAWFFKCERDG